MKKRKHHYVWEYYLQGWAIDGQIWCQRAEKRFPVSTENIAHCRDFYRLKEMSAHDFEVVELLISRMGEHLRPVARGWIPHFKVFHEAKRAYEASGKSNPELEVYLDEVINDMEEDIHASVENGATEILGTLREGDAGILDDEETFIHFARFVGMQYMRTPGMSRRFTENDDLPGFNLDASLGLIRTILATNIGWSLYARRRTLRLTFLEAPRDLEFITGDQPIVNARSLRAAAGTPPTELELYYPLTPARALLLNPAHGPRLTERRQLTATEAARYNEMIVAMADEQIYARSGNALITASTRGA